MYSVSFYLYSVISRIYSVSSYLYSVISYIYSVSSYLCSVTPYIYSVSPYFVQSHLIYIQFHFIQSSVLHLVSHTVRVDIVPHILYAADLEIKNAGRIIFFIISYTLSMAQSNFLPMMLLINQWYLGSWKLLRPKIEKEVFNRKKSQRSYWVKKMKQKHDGKTSARANFRI